MRGAQPLFSGRGTWARERAACKSPKQAMRRQKDSSVFIAIRIIGARKSIQPFRQSLDAIGRIDYSQLAPTFGRRPEYKATLRCRRSIRKPVLAPSLERARRDALIF